MYQSQQITKKQALILSLLQELHDTLSAQDVFRALKTRGHGIGLATVYRALDSLKLQGIIRSTTTPAGEALYSIIPLDRHHLYCLHCSRSFTIDMCPLEEMNQKFKQTYDFEIFYHTLEFFGVCRECQGRKQAQTFALKLSQASVDTAANVKGENKRKLQKILHNKTTTN